MTSSASPPPARVTSLDTRRASAMSGCPSPSATKRSSPPEISGKVNAGCSWAKVARLASASSSAMASTQRRTEGPERARQRPRAAAQKTSQRTKRLAAMATSPLCRSSAKPTIVCSRASEAGEPATAPCNFTSRGARKACCSMSRKSAT